MANTLYPQLQSFTLYSSGATVGDTSLVLSTMKDIDGTQLAMANFGDKGFLTLDPGAGTSEEQVSFSGITANANGTTTLTGVKTVLCLSPYTETSGIAKSHSGGSTVVAAITSGLLNQFSNKGNTETITGTWTFPNGATTPLLGTSYVAPTISWQVASKGYVDSVAIAGAPDANTTVKGIVEIATGAELAAGTGTGGTGAAVVPAGSSFTNTSAGAGDVNKVAVLDAAGQFAVGFIKDTSTTVAGKSELATAAETAAGTATGGSGSPLVPANSTFVQTSSGSADANKVPVLGSAGVLADGFRYETGTSGEAITAGHGVYLKASDSKFYKSLGTGDEATFSFVGVAADTAGAADVTIRIIPPGQVLTTTGLTAGAYYFVTDVAGVLGTTPGTRFARVGLALSTTRLIVTLPKYIVKGSFTVSGTGNTTVTTGFYPAYIQIRGGVNSAGAQYGEFSVGDDSNTCVKSAFGTTGANSDCVGGGAADLYNMGSSTQLLLGTVSAKSATGFTFNTSAYSSGGGVWDTHTIQWAAFSE